MVEIVKKELRQNLNEYHLQLLQLDVIESDQTQSSEPLTEIRENLNDAIKLTEECLRDMTEGESMNSKEKGADDNNNKNKNSLHQNEGESNSNKNSKYNNNENVSNQSSIQNQNIPPEKTETEYNNNDLTSNNDFIIYPPGLGYESESNTSSCLNLNSNESSLANWENHTKGIGSKLLRQMGYKDGSGLGLNSTGRLNPILPTFQPSSKISLDLWREKEKYLNSNTCDLGFDNNKNSSFFKNEKDRNNKNNNKKRKSILEQVAESLTNKTIKFKNGNKNKNEKNIKSISTNPIDIKKQLLALKETKMKIQSEVDSLEKSMERQKDINLKSNSSDSRIIIMFSKKLDVARDKMKNIMYEIERIENGIIHEKRNQKLGIF